MPLTKDQKAAVVTDIGGLLASSKMTVVARYSGMSVKDMQGLRKSALEDDTQLRIAKNRLFKIALASNDKLKAVDTSKLVGQLMYSFNAEDEAAPARSLAAFAKTHPQIEFVGAITSDAQFLSTEDVRVLADLPTKDQLQAQLLATLSAPATSFVSVLVGNIRSVLNVLNSRAKALAE